LIIRLLVVTLALQCIVFFIQEASGSSFTLAGGFFKYTGESNGPNLRATGTVGTTPSGFCTFVEPLILIALALFRTSKSRRERILWGILVAGGALAVVLSLCRASWIGLTLGILCVEYLCRSRGTVPRSRQTSIFYLATVLVVISVLVLPLITPRLEQSHKDDWTVRYNLIRAAANMIAANPVIGVGPGAYTFRLREYAPSDVGWLYYVHNEYLLVWAERGILGLLAWLLWLRAGLRQALSGTRMTAEPFQAFAIGCAAGFIVLLWEFMLNSCEPFSVNALVWSLFGVLLGNDTMLASRRSPGKPAWRGGLLNPDWRRESGPQRQLVAVDSPVAAC
jgi:O-antigen ligase